MSLTGPNERLYGVWSDRGLLLVTRERHLNYSRMEMGLGDIEDYKVI